MRAKKYIALHFNKNNNKDLSTMPKFTVIIPIFKVEAYLRTCVDSVLSQTFSDIEVILVDDGSPDGCPAICDEYAAADSRVTDILTIPCSS